MNIYKLLLVTILSVFLGSCKDKPTPANDLFELSIKNLKKTYTQDDSFSFSVINKKGTAIDSVSYYLTNDQINSDTTLSEVSVSLKNQKLGSRKIIAKIYSEGNLFVVSKKISVLSNIKPKIYSYKILEEYPHDDQAYTQGLEFHDGILYESTGQYGKSSLRKTNYETGEVYKNVPLQDAFFGEGLTIINNKVYQLTWKEKMGFIYNLETLEKTGSFIYGKSKEGWGLCNDGNVIYKSDGTQKIWTLNANTLGEEDFIEIYTNTSKIKSVNELEWVEGKIYANIYLKDAVAIVNPKDGAVEGVIDFTTLKNHIGEHKEDEVLNGIAYKGEPNILYVTGKNWEKLFKVEIIEK